MSKIVETISQLPEEAIDRVARRKHRIDCAVYTGRTTYTGPYNDCTVRHRMSAERAIIDVCVAFNITEEKLHELLDS